MNALTLSGWGNFLVAVASAAATLAGLVFVALSINLTKILGQAGHQERAGETMILLAGVLVVALLGLVPGQPLPVLGTELLVVGLLAGGIPTVIHIRAFRGRHYSRRGLFIARVVLHQIATLPVLMAAASLILGSGAGLYWIVPALVLSMIVAMINAWVLLIEILR